MANNIFAQFLKAQSEFPSVKKAFTAKAFKGGGNYQYADISSILEIVRPILNRNSLCLFQNTATEGQFVGVETVLRNAEGEEIKSGFIYVPTADLMQRGVQAFGSAMTYARRYSLVTFLGLAYGDKDDDGQAATEHLYADTAPAAPAKPVVDITALESAAKAGIESYKAAFTALSKEQKKLITGNGEHERLKKLANEASTPPWGDEDSPL